RSDGIAPDPSWSEVDATSPEHTESMPALRLTVCAYADWLWCDAVDRTMPAMPENGGAFDLTIPVSRLLLTSLPDWVDCARVTCAVVANRTIIDHIDGPATYGYTVPAAFVPYVLPTDVADATLPSLTIEAAPPYRVGENVKVTLHDVPAGVEPTGMQLAQCAA